MQFHHFVLCLTNHGISHCSSDRSLNLCEPQLKHCSWSPQPGPAPGCSGMLRDAPGRSGMLEGSEEPMSEEVLGEVWEVFFKLIQKPCNPQFAQCVLVCPSRGGGGLAIRTAWLIYHL